MVENLDQDLHLIKEKIYDLAGVYIVHFDHPIAKKDAILRPLNPFFFIKFCPFFL